MYRWRPAYLIAKMKESRPPEFEHRGNQMYLVDLRRLVSDADSLDAILNGTRDLWSRLYERMSADETLWVIAPNDYRDGQMWPVAMAVADFAREESSLVLKNIITHHTWEDRGADMESAYDEILFFVHNKREYQFHKDRIRVAHVYEGHEWGGEREEGKSAYHDRKVARYNPDGKDPGNVWLEEDRTQTDNQEVDKTGPIPIEEAIRRCVLVGSNEGETVHVISNDQVVIDTVAGENRPVERLDLASFHSGVTS